MNERLQIAAMILPALTGEFGAADEEVLARRAFVYADALIAEGQKDAEDSVDNCPCPACRSLEAHFKEVEDATARTACYLCAGWEDGHELNCPTRN